MFDRYLLAKQSRTVVVCALVGLLALNSTSPANPEPVTVEVESVVQVTITKSVAANFTIPTAPAQAIAILVDATVDGTGYELASVRCEYNAGDDAACNGSGMPATSAASANLLVDATVTGDGLAATEGVNISFDVTVAYH